MNDRTDNELLADYAAERSETAFAELVRRHVNLVYSAALRMTCDSYAAQDVTQKVFVLLGQQARQLRNRRALEGWLHSTARNLAVKHVRSDVRRRAREQEAAVMKELLGTDPDASWEDIAPHLDEALGSLKESERDVLLLRYFKNRDLHSIGLSLGISEDAAQKRVSRALERLRDFLTKRGIAVGASGLILVITANAVHGAPAGLAAASSAAAFLAGTSIVSPTAILMTTLQKAVIGTTLAAAVGTGVYQTVRLSTSRAQLNVLKKEHAHLAEQTRQLLQERDDATSKLAALGQDTPGTNRKSGELPKLKAEAPSRIASGQPGQPGSKTAFTSIPTMLVVKEQRLEDPGTQTALVVQENAGDISGTITLNGTPPPERENIMIKADVVCGKLHSEPVMTHFYVVGEQNGLGDVLVVLRGVFSKPDGAVAPPVLVEQTGCEYKPYIFAVQTKQKILVRNSDPVMHNVQTMPNSPGNVESNLAQMAGAPDLSFSFPSPEIFLRFSCQVHPWMLAYACVVDHPYFAVTDKNGKYTIKNVPYGKYAIEIYHRKAAPVSAPMTGEVQVGGNVIKDFTLQAK